MSLDYNAQTLLTMYVRGGGKTSTKASPPPKVDEKVQYIGESSKERTNELCGEVKVRFWVKWFPVAVVNNERNGDDGKLGKLD